MKLSRAARTYYLPYGRRDDAYGAIISEQIPSRAATRNLLGGRIEDKTRYGRRLEGLSDENHGGEGPTDSLTNKLSRQLAGVKQDPWAKNNSPEPESNR